MDDNKKSTNIELRLNLSKMLCYSAVNIVNSVFVFMPLNRIIMKKRKLECDLISIKL